MAGNPPPPAARELKSLMIPIPEDKASMAKSMLEEARSRIISRVLDAKERYPEQPVALHGKQLRELVNDYAAFGQILNRLIDLKALEDVVDRILDTDPTNIEGLTLKQEHHCFECFNLIGHNALLPFLERSAVAYGLDPAPFTICFEHLTPESRAVAQALAQRLALIAERAEEQKSPADPAGEDEPAGPALTKSQSRVLQTMALFDASRLVSADAIAAEMDAAGRLSARTIGPIVLKLIGLDLAERPEGRQLGARLTIAGRRLASKIAD